PSVNELTKILSNLLNQSAILLGIAMMLLVAVPQKLSAQTGTLPPVSKLKKLSVEELMNIEVTSVSKTPQKLAEVASAIQVLTGEDIRRSPAILLPEILRLAPNLQVTRSGSHDWAVTARGFNGFPIANSSLADKLLVTIDGRAVYNSLFGGVYWDVQGVLKDEIDRIEVVSGPGGTLWGANAVNGVINLISKSAKETQGLVASASVGSFLHDGFAARYGSHVDSTFFYRVYANRFDFGNTKTKNGSDAMDDWNMTRSGFRMDFMPSTKNTLTVQGDLYFGNEDIPDSVATLVNGQNLLARWTHSFSGHSNLNIQAYFDRTWRNIKRQGFTDEINTFDIDIQHGFKLGKHSNILWGLDYRTLNDITKDTSKTTTTFTPLNRVLPLFSAFLQDQLTLIPNRLELTLGTKILHNYYTQFEWQPSIRLAWTVSSKQTIWSAVSRAVRTPSRYDVDLTSFVNIDHPFKSENVIAYELGYRVRPKDNMSFSLATFFNDYRELRSIDATGDPIVPYVFANSLEAKTWGIEFSGNYVVTPSWRLRGGATYLGEDFDSTSVNTYPGNSKFEAIDPNFQCLLQSILNLPKNIELDFLCKYVDDLDGSAALGITKVPGYFSLDLRCGWTYKSLTLGVSVLNLTDKNHVEFGTRQIPRSIHGKIGFRF
ncbi:MAG: TonB-dependent receptor plug domain-containing protein, partial [Ferruginibacter sp.]